MNLALENLIRNNSIKNLIEFPFSLCLESKTGFSMYVTVENHKSNLLINKFDLSKIDELSLNSTKTLDFSNIKEVLKVHHEQLFEKNVVVNEGFKPIMYSVDSVDVNLNSYNKPMMKNLYDSFYENILNSKSHKSYKRLWLWYNFSSKCEVFKYCNYRDDMKKTNHIYNNKHDREYKDKFLYVATNHFRSCKQDSNYRYVLKNFSNLEKLLSIKEKGPAGELIFYTES